jgi:hypothetical protein
MREFNEADYSALQPYEEHLQRGVFGKYYYGLRRTDFNAMLDVYRSLGYTQTMDYSCGRCILQLTTTLGKPYFEFKKKMEEKAKNTKRKVGEFNADGELVREFESVTQAVSETGITKAQIYKALKEQAEIDERIFKYLQD